MNFRQFITEQCTELILIKVRKILECLQRFFNYIEPNQENLYFPIRCSSFYEWFGYLLVSYLLWDIFMPFCLYWTGMYKYWWLKWWLGAGMLVSCLCAEQVRERRERRGEPGGESLSACLLTAQPHHITLNRHVNLPSTTTTTTTKYHFIDRTLVSVWSLVESPAAIVEPLSCPRPE